MWSREPRKRDEKLIYRQVENLMPLRELVNGDAIRCDVGAGEMRFVLMLEKYKVQTAGGLAHTPHTHTHSGISRTKVLLRGIYRKINE